MTDELVFYTNPQSRGRIVRWMLEEAGAPYRTEILQYGAMKTPEYLAINPMGKVPAITHGDVVVTECAAICAYLADVFADAALAPPTNARGAYYRWLFFAAGPLEAAILNHSLGFEVAPEQQMAAGYGSYETAMDMLEKAVPETGFLCGEQFTAADVYVGSQINFGLEFGIIDKRAAFRRYSERLKARPAFARAAELDAAAAG